MRLERNFPYWILVSGAAAWLGLAFLAPWALARGWPGAGLAYAVFDPVCHQMAGRSFFCFGHPLAACHRCMGLYSGLAAGFLMWPYCHRLREFLLARPRTLLIFFAPMAIDWTLMGLNTPASRFATGLVAAWPVALFVWAAAEQLYRQTSRPSQRGDHELSHAQ